MTDRPQVQAWREAVVVIDLRLAKLRPWNRADRAERRQLREARRYAVAQVEALSRADSR